MIHDGPKVVTMVECLEITSSKFDTVCIAHRYQLRNYRYAVKLVKSRDDDGAPLGARIHCKHVLLITGTYVKCAYSEDAIERLRIRFSSNIYY